MWFQAVWTCCLFYHSCSSATSLLKWNKIQLQSVGVRLSLIFVLFSSTTEKQQVIVFNYTMKKSSNSFSWCTGKCWIKVLLFVPWKQELVSSGQSAFRMDCRNKQIWWLLWFNHAVSNSAEKCCISFSVGKYGIRNALRFWCLESKLCHPVLYDVLQNSVWLERYGFHQQKPVQKCSDLTQSCMHSLIL